MPQRNMAATVGWPPTSDERACYRYRTAALVGPWRRQSDRALSDAVGAGQARREDCGSLKWLVDGRIEQSLCEHGGACGGVYPPD